MKPVSKTKLLLQFIIGIPIMILILFWPAGTLKWTEAWIYLILQMGYSGIMAIYFLKHNPELIKKRMEMKLPSRLWDKLVMFPFIIAMITLLIIICLILTLQIKQLGLLIKAKLLVCRN